MNTIGGRIKHARAAMGLSQSQLGKRLGVDASAVSQWEVNKTAPNSANLAKLATVLKRSAVWLRFGTEETIADELDEFAREDMESVIEVDTRAGAGGGGFWSTENNETNDVGYIVSADVKKAEWMLPTMYLRQYLGIYSRNAKIIEIAGDSMAPTLMSGDRVIIDLSQRNPSPPGMFAIWDGVGVVCKRLELLTNTDPHRLMLISDNPKNLTYERTAEEVNIIGRVVWYARRA